MSNIKFHNDRYWQFKYDLKDFIINERRLNHPIKEKNISLSVSKGYNLLRNHQKKNEKNGKENPIDICLLYHSQVNAS